MSYRLADDNGWYLTTALDGRPRIVIPATNTRGYAYYQGRAIEPDVKLRYMSPDYSSSDSLVIVYPEQTQRRLVLVEGAMDALAAAEHGYIGIAMMGKHVREDAFDHLVSKFRDCLMTIIPDSDGFSVTGTWVAALALRGVAATVRFTGYKDLAVMPREEREAFLGH